MFKYCPNLNLMPFVIGEALSLDDGFEYCGLERFATFWTALFSLVEGPLCYNIVLVYFQLCLISVSLS